MSVVKCAAAFSTLSITDQPGNKLEVPGDIIKKRNRRPKNKNKEIGNNNGNEKKPTSNPSRGPAVANSMKKNNALKKTIKKTVADFKCTGESCGKTWSSVHAWASRQVMCEFCDTKAKVVNFVDEMCELDHYSCPCTNSWQSIHAADIMEQSCDVCEIIVRKDDGTQQRFGRHYWYKCINRECLSEWEDFYQGRAYSQRCKVCFSAGEMFRTRQALNVHEIQRRSRSGMFGNGGGHDVEGCDMCQEIRRQGVAGTCTRKRIVVFQLDSQQDGAVTERIVAAV